MEKTKNDWKKTFKKFATSAAIVILTGLVSYWQNDPRYIALIPFLVSGLNWLKHRKG